MAAIRAGLPQAVKAGPSGSEGADPNGTFVYPVIDAGWLGLRQLVVQTGATTDPSGTVVRIDAEVQSIAERLANQAIPTAARVVDITRPATASPPGVSPPSRRRLGSPAVSLRVTRPARAAALARDVDALPFAGNLSGVAFSCPEFGTLGPTVAFTFRARAGGPALASVRVQGATPTTIDPCLTSTLFVGGHRQPGLTTAGVLLKQADRLLGVRLTTRSAPTPSVYVTGFWSS